MLARAVVGLLPAARVRRQACTSTAADVLTMTAEALAAPPRQGRRHLLPEPAQRAQPRPTVGASSPTGWSPIGVRASRRSAEAAAGSSRRSASGTRRQRLAAYPHELSGGMAQRVMISLAHGCAPAMLVADEPTTGLDVTLTRRSSAASGSAAIAEWNRAVLLISHDLAAIAEVCDRIAVLYAGTLVEDGPATASCSRADPSVYARASAAAPDVSGEPTRALGGAMPTLRADALLVPVRAPLPARPRRLLARRCPPLVTTGARRSRSACFVRGHRARGRPRRGPAGARGDRRRAAAGGAGPAAPILRVADVDVVYRARFGRGGSPALRGVCFRPPGRDPRRRRRERLREEHARAR